MGQPPAHPCTRVPVFLPVASSFAPLHMGLVLLCTYNRPPFIKQASRSVSGRCAHLIRSNSTVSISTWRHAALSQRFRPSPIAASHTHLTVRAASWATKFNLRRTSSSSDSDAHEEAAKAAVLEAIKGRQQTDLMLRCTVLDAEGNVKTISGQFKRSNLCAEHRLNPRDLRKIDSRIPNLVPTILPRREVILVNVLHIRALVKADAVVLFDTYGSTDSRLHSVFLYHLEVRSSPFVRGVTACHTNFGNALESIFISVVSALEAEMVFIRNLVGGLLAELEDDINHDKFKRLLHYSRRLTSFQNRVKLVEAAFEETSEIIDFLSFEILDEDLAAMYLTDRKNDVPRQLSDHEELELLLETFSKQVEEIVNEAENIHGNVQSTQEIVELILDSNRNALLALDLKVSIGTMGIGTGALIAGLFGMNASFRLLTSRMEELPYAFAGMSVASALIALLVAWTGLRRLAKIQKVGLSASSSKKVKGWLPLSLRQRRPEI
ncbi:Mg2+ transporter protein cora-like protein [Lactarius akahatsu]|uniref:Magnesium transporter n=1 Tax=Lactarius akahatsu TaxID=416441 RepID=A0AAD4LMH2_9AGAM|nr:Mg2+ transporter protein cora-like protein [Lactarius akahatsu]KAH8992622.1 Mg2+ transporter protein cora-like protein [Lactarius akahatsu]